MSKLYNNSTKHSKRNILAYSLVLFSLLAPKRMKYISPLSIDNIRIENTAILLSIGILIYMILKFVKEKKIVFNRKILLLSFLLVLFLVVQLFKINSLSQFIYANVIIVTPIIGLILSSNFNKHDRIRFERFLFICTFFYSILAILLTQNFAVVMKLFGNSTDNYRYYSHFRASMMLGSSITVSYFFNLTLPFLFLMLDKKSKFTNSRIIILSILLNISATLLLMSRLSFVIMVLTTLVNLKKYLKNVNKIITLSVLLVPIIFLGILFFEGIDLSRLNLSDSLTNNSTLDRFDSLNFGIDVFRENIVLGTGAGQVFPRVYLDRTILYGNQSGLVDPHNLYILILSEYGFIASAVIFCVVLKKIQSIKKISDNSVKLVAYQTIGGMLIAFIGGSHLANEPSFALLFWIVIGYYFSYLNVEV